MSHQQWQPGPQGPYQNIIIQSSRPRQSCAIHAVLALCTFGIGNIAYAIWHNRRYGQ